MRTLTVLFAAMAAIAAAAPAVAQAPNLNLTIARVSGGPQGSVTMVRYGELVRVSGDVSSGQAGETVLVTVSPYRGEETTRPVTTETDGEFSVTDKPAVRTSYTARWRGQASSQEPFADVRPGVSLKVTSARQGRFAVRLAANPAQVSRVV